MKLTRSRSLVRNLAALFVATLAGAASAQAPTTQPAQPPFDMPTTALHPLVTVPILQYTPRLDGVIDVKGEYYPSTRLHEFICIDGDDRGTTSAYPSHAVLSYTAKGLFVAFKVEMPAGASPKISATEGADRGME